MCGIVGIIASKNGISPDSQALVREMAQKIKHRGPDGDGFFNAPGVSLGMVRLSIIDTAHGWQPVYGVDRDVVSVFNGEIYNYLELRQSLIQEGVKFSTESDSEVLVKIFERRGLNGLKQLNGMFAAAVYDAKSGSTTLFRDRTGEKPLYYWVSPDRTVLVFASEIKALSVCSFIPRQLNKQALLDLFSYNYVPGEQTIFAGIQQLAPGHYLKFTPGTAPAIHAYWSLQENAPQANREFDEVSWTEHFYEIFEHAVRIRLRSDVPLGSFLSAGIDSNAVTWIAARRLAHHFKTFSIGFDDPNFDEAVFASQVARQLGLDPYVQINRDDSTDRLPTVLYHLDQPHGDASFVPLYDLCSFASAHVKVALSGDGGDEIFGGYSKYNAFSKNLENGLPEMQALAAYFDASSVFSGEELRKLFRDNRDLDFDKPKNLFFETYGVLADQDAENKLLFTEVRLLLPGNNLVKPDRMGMAHGLEMRAPFLDHNLIEHAFRMPGKMKFDSSRTKIGMRKALEALLPPEILHRRKMMLTVPVGEWYRKGLSGFVRATLSADSALAKSGLFNWSYVDLLVKEHIDLGKDRTRQVRLLIALALWSSVSEMFGKCEG